MYIVVIWNIRVNNNKIIDSIASQSVRKRRRREIWYAVQLIVVNAIFMSVWILFQILNRVLPADKADSGVFSTVIFVDILNASTNSLVLITLNQEVKKALRKLLLNSTEISSGAVGAGTTLAAPSTGAGVSALAFVH